jgi:hypothetical protein
MADNSVFITGAAKGAFQEAMEGLPPWATEKTAFKIQSLLQKNLGQQTKLLTDLVKKSGGSSGMSPADATKFNSELDKLIKHLTDGNKEEDKKKKRDKEREVADKKSLLGVKEFDNKWQKAQFVLDGLAVVGKKVLDADKQYLKTYDAMYKSGINVLSGQNEFTDGFQMLNHVVTETGLRLETLQEVSSKYASAVNAVGFNKWAKASGMAVQNMNKLGYSSTETADMMGAYIDQESHFTDMRGKSEKELSAGVQTFGKQIRDTSLALGISREKVLANSKALSESTDISTIEAEYGKTAADNVKSALMGLDPAVASKFTDLVANAGVGIGVMSDAVMDMAKSGNHYSTEILQMGQDLRSMDIKSFNAKWQSLVNSPAWAAEMKRMQLLKGGKTEAAGSAGAARDFMAGMKNYSNRVNQATDAQTENTVTTQASITNLDTQLEKLSASVQAAFSPMISQVNALAGSLELLNKSIYSVINHTNAESRSWAGVGLIGAGGLATGALMMGKAKTLFNLFSKSGAASAEAGAGASTLGKVASGGKSMLALGLLARAALGAAGDYGAGKLGVGKDANGNDIQLNKSQDDANWEKMTTMEQVVSSIPRGIEKIGDLFFLNNLSRQAASDRIQKETAGLRSRGASTINSPSAVSVEPQNADTSSSASNPSTPVSPGIEKTPANTDINSTLAYQANLLAQILLASENNVSVNKDILKYTRNRT